MAGIIVFWWFHRRKANQQQHGVLGRATHDEGDDPQLKPLGISRGFDPPQAVPSWQRDKKSVIHGMNEMSGRKSPQELPSRQSPWQFEGNGLVELE